MRRSCFALTYVVFIAVRASDAVNEIFGFACYLLVRLYYFAIFQRPLLSFYNVFVAMFAESAFLLAAGSNDFTRFFESVRSR